MVVISFSLVLLRAVVATRFFAMRIEGKATSEVNPVL
jgi:hypothetical protein